MQSETPQKTHVECWLHGQRPFEKLKCCQGSDHGIQVNSVSNRGSHVRAKTARDISSDGPLVATNPSFAQLLTSDLGDFLLALRVRKPGETYLQVLFEPQQPKGPNTDPKR